MEGKVCFCWQILILWTVSLLLQSNEDSYSVGIMFLCLFLLIDSAECISDIEGVRRTLYHCASDNSDVSVVYRVIKLDWIHYTIWCRNTVPCQNIIWLCNTTLSKENRYKENWNDIILSLSFFLSWFHWWLWLLWLPASSEVLSSPTAASLHVSYKIISLKNYFRSHCWVFVSHGVLHIYSVARP